MEKLKNNLILFKNYTLKIKFIFFKKAKKRCALLIFSRTNIYINFD